MKTTGMIIAATLAATLPAHAGEGHDHGPAPAALAGPAAPRFTAASDLFELVGVVEGRRLALYLGRHADSSPVREARLEIELGGVKLPVAPHGEGQFEALLAAAPKPGLIPVAATIFAGDDSDLLAGELDVHDEHAAAAAAPAASWRAYAAGGAAVALAMLFAAIGLRRFAAARRGGAA